VRVCIGQLSYTEYNKQSGQSNPNYSLSITLTIDYISVTMLSTASILGTSYNPVGLTTIWMTDQMMEYY